MFMYFNGQKMTT